MSCQSLFEPITLGTLVSKNRIAMAPMGLGIGYDDQEVHDAMIPFLESRSRGGTGLIISEGFQATRYVNPGGLMLGAHEDRFIPGLERYARAIHKYGSLAFMQIMAMGGKDKGQGYAPSSINSPYYAVRPKALTEDQIAEVIGDFADSGRRAQKSGFDGVELHGGYSYLIGEFMSPHFNRRDDDYGGDFERRMRVPIEIVRRIKNLCGKNFPIGFKFSAWEDAPNGVKHELAVKIAQQMADEGVVYVHAVSSDSFFRYPALPPMYSPRNTLSELSENLKKHIRNLPIICAAGIIDPQEADVLIGEGKADMVAVGRALLADPEWPNKAKQGIRIRPCIRCNICHHKVVVVEEEIACTVNPHLVRENEESLAKAGIRKDIMVVGSGPAGIWCSLIASRRGHRVTLYEQKYQLGGLLVPGSTPPFKRDVGVLLNYYRAEIGDSEVEVKLGKKVIPELVREIRPDVLVVAVGAEPIQLNVPGGDSKHVINASDALADPDNVRGQHVAVIGGGEIGCETALYLSGKGKDVSVVEALDDILLINEIETKSAVLRGLLEQADIEIHTSSQVQEIKQSAIQVANKDGKRAELPADSVILAVGLRPEKRVVKQMMDACTTSHSIGDCVNPARILEAVAEADRLGRLL
jgi:2,4-dienoyl-CoA reductase-like NADH-dependent reductase (Old Yellow Enzyme family)/thioredoxin reductase